MVNKLITIEYTNGEKSQALHVDITMELAEARILLTGKKIMQESDSFLFNNAEVLLDDEANTTIEEILIDNILHIGHSKTQGISGDPDEVTDWRYLTANQQIDLLRKCQLNRGIIFFKDGIKKSYEELFSWKTIPSMSVPRENTNEESAYSFLKVTRDLNLLASNRATLALDTPFINVDSEYKYSKEQSSSRNEVTEYLMQKYEVLKATFTFDPNALIVNDKFILEINNAYNNGKNETEKICYLIDALNKWGMYIPIQVTVGGALYSYEETNISEFSQATKEINDFSIAVKAEYGSYGGSTGYDQGSETSGSQSVSHKYKNLVIKQIGGQPGCNKKDFLPNTLSNAMHWEIVNIEEFYPSLLLLLNTEESSVRNKVLLANCLELFKQYFYIPVVKKYQPIINIKKYADEISNMINPW